MRRKSIQSCLEYHQDDLIFCFVHLQQFFIEASYILSQRFSFLLVDVDKMPNWLLVSFSFDEMTNKAHV